MKHFLLFFSFTFFVFSFSQKETTLFFHVEKLSVKYKTVNDSTAGKRYKERALQEFRLNGYTGLTLKDSVVKNSSVHYYYNFNHKFEKIILRDVADSSGRKSFSAKDYLSTLRNLNKKITYLENNGFPFASITILLRSAAGISLRLIK